MRGGAGRRGAWLLDRVLKGVEAAVQCRAANTLPRAHEWLRRRRSTIRPLTNVGIARQVNAAAALRNCKHRLRELLVSYGASSRRGRIPVRLSHAPTDSSTGFSYASGMSVCFPCSPRVSRARRCQNQRKPPGSVWGRVLGTSAVISPRELARNKSQRRAHQPILARFRGKIRQ